MTNYRPTVAEIDLGAVRHNVTTLRSFLRPGTEALAVVKANAYGHGDVEVARAALDAGATRLGVALVEEGIRLRDAGFAVPILLLIEPTRDAAKDVVARQLTASLSTSQGADALNEAATAAGTKARVHVCIDTGMHREGFALDGAMDFIRDVTSMPGLEVEGLWSHFAMGELDKHPFTAAQIELFTKLCDEVEGAGIDISVRHLTSSGGIVLYPDAQFDLVRIGIMLYGLYPEESLRAKCTLQPVMKLVSAVGLVRRVPAGEGISYGHTFAPDIDTTIATVPIGYGDGYPRLLSSTGDVLIGGKRRRIAGRVTMDTIMVDCGNDDVAPSDEVVLIGRQGDDEITATELADKTQTINYETVSSIGPRVPRVFVG